MVVTVCLRRRHRQRHERRQQQQQQRRLSDVTDARHHDSVTHFNDLWIRLDDTRSHCHYIHYIHRPIYVFPADESTVPVYVIVRPLSTVGYTSVVASVIHSRQWSN